MMGKRRAAFIFVVTLILTDVLMAAMGFYAVDNFLYLFSW